jgi:hypothetical protein
MTENYANIISNNLYQLFNDQSRELTQCLPAKKAGDSYTFKAFGETCRISPNGIFLDERQDNEVIGILISLYALHVQPSLEIIEPLKSFKEMPNSMPYAGAFKTHTELPLVPHVNRIEVAQERIIQFFDGIAGDDQASGDFSFRVQPLPKISLTYIFYRADDEFPASATCLYSNNAADFMPIDGLADVGEYSSKKILSLLKL